MSDSQQAQPRVAAIGSGYWGVNLVRNFRALAASYEYQNGPTGKQTSTRRRSRTPTPSLTENL